MIRTLIVDDVALARERVRRYLVGESDIEVVGEAANGADAVRLAAETRPLLVFLDIGLPDIDGFEVVKRLPPQGRPVVIFLTAHDDRALQAFDVNALDYLVKPFGHERFQQALDRARRQLRLQAGAAAEPPRYVRRMAIRDGARTDVVDMETVDYIDVAGHYLCLHVGKRVHLIRGSLGELEARLDPAEFIRIHRSIVVRIDRVRSLAARRNGDSDVLLADGGKLLLSRTYRDAVRPKLGFDET
ncbi:MAG: response regulator transcription factor [Alphaproteobacteria bacterium]|nr:response regulator transcription factor [Alphaproteobacteria bacterium]MDE1985465.1 response regulator transcription factor [Alphaproteobacteria bacterium]